MTRTELIAALEKAVGASRELDRDIALTLDMYPETIREDLGCYLDDPAMTCGGGEVWAPPAFTSSIDAALTLVPDGWRVQVLSEWDNPTLRSRGPWQAILCEAGQGDGMNGKPRCDHAPNPAIALCIAALKARGETP